MSARAIIAPCHRVILGTKGYIELRKYLDVARDKAGDNVYIVDDKGERHVNVSGKDVAAYRFKVGQVGQIQCASYDGYSGQQPVTSPLPCTPRGIIDLLLRHDIDLHGADIVIVGRGVTVGRSIGLLLTRREINATVTLTHTGTEDLAEHTRNADVVIAAAGVPGIITADIVKPGAVVIDVGVSRSTDPETGKSRVVGDVDPGVREVASRRRSVPRNERLR